VPISIVKQKFGREIEAEALESIADDEFRRYASEESQHVVGHPTLSDISKSSDGVAFTIGFEIMPDFSLGDYKGLNVQRLVRVASEQDVQDEIDRICLRAASFEPAVEVTDPMYVVTVSLHELDRDTSLPIIGAEAKEQRVFLDDDNIDLHLRNSIQGLKIGDSFQYIAETPDEKTQPPSYRVTVTDIQKVVPAEFNNEFVETVSEGKLHSTEELRGDITQQLNEYFQQASRDSLENQIVDQLIKDHTFDVPGSLVHAVIHQLFDDFKKRNEGAPGLDKLTAHDLEHEFQPAAERIVKWELIRDKIIQAENIELTDADAAAAAGRFGVTEDQMRMVMRQNRNVADQLLAEKAVQMLLDYAIITDVNVDS
jgi:trigger factor